ncbi:MAG: MraY family glycosyltransferase, partial [Bacilli bacterium]
MNEKIIEVLKIVAFVMAFTAILFPLVKKISIHIGAVDYPNERKIHKKPMPRAGGLMMFFGFIFGYMLFAQENTQMLAILIASFIVVLTGIIDDISPLKARQKLIGQVVAACIVTFYGNILLNDISAFGLYFDFGIFAYPLTIIFMVALMNCINFIDGLDGLAAGISAIFFTTIGIIAFIMHNIGSLEITLTFIMIGASLGFLIFNFNPAKIFMGESGSMFLGFMISVVCLVGFKAVTLTSLVVPMLILAIPILDTFFAIIRRIINKKPIYEADKEHLHHQLLNKKFSQRKTVLIIYAVSILFSLTSIFYVLKDA